MRCTDAAFKTISVFHLPLHHPPPIIHTRVLTSSRANIRKTFLLNNTHRSAPPPTGFFLPPDTDDDAITDWRWTPILWWVQLRSDIRVHLPLFSLPSSSLHIKWNWEKGFPRLSPGTHNPDSSKDFSWLVGIVCLNEGMGLAWRKDGMKTSVSSSSKSEMFDGKCSYPTQSLSNNRKFINFLYKNEILRRKHKNLWPEVERRKIVLQRTSEEPGRWHRAELTFFGITFFDCSLLLQWRIDSYSTQVGSRQAHTSMLSTSWETIAEKG